MVVFWFLLALVLLLAALYLLRLDRRQRGGSAGRGPRAAASAGSAGTSPGLDDDDEDLPAPDPADEADGRTVAQVEEPGAPRLAPFQQEAASSDPAPGAVSPAGGVGEPDQADDDEPAEPATGPAEPTTESSPRLLDWVRAFLPAKRQGVRPPETLTEDAVVDQLADSPVVRWLEDREFEPTPTPAPEFLHGDFAGGLTALGTVSHGMFRGRRAIMGVTGGRTVLALRRDTASDVVLDLSRPDVDAEPGFHDAGEVAALEARTSDYGRLDLLDRDRLAAAVGEVPAGVRRVWAEGEWVAATVDGTDDPSTWDDVVVALHGTADVLAPLPPIGGRARALPSEIDPGAPGAAGGPDADPAVGMDGGTGTGATAAAGAVVPSTAPAAPAGSAPGSTSDETAPEPDTAESAATETAEPAEHPAGPAAETAEPRRTGHLRLVPDRKGVRELSDVPVVADRGDTEPAAQTPEQLPEELTEELPAEPDPFAEIMEPTGQVPSRGDVASDHLEPRPPLSRPTRGAGHAYPEDASVPPLAAGAITGGAGIKPLGSEDDEDEIRDEVARFDAARIDGGSDLDTGPTGRHGPEPVNEGAGEGTGEGTGEETGRLSVAELAARMGAAPASGRHRHRRADAEGEPETDSADDAGSAGDAAPGRERPGVEPDVERTARIELPPDIRD